MVFIDLSGVSIMRQDRGCDVRKCSSRSGMIPFGVENQERTDNQAMMINPFRIEKSWMSNSNHRMSEKSISVKNMGMHGIVELVFKKKNDQLETALVHDVFFPAHALEFIIHKGNGKTSPVSQQVENILDQPVDFVGKKPKT